MEVKAARAVVVTEAMEAVVAVLVLHQLSQLEHLPLMLSEVQAVNLEEILVHKQDMVLLMVKAVTEHTAPSMFSQQEMALVEL